ncbi:ribosome maturation factor RimP [Clostridium cochlearium]|uniref:ribosome maturation factor RimP n=1 Tax=Clostridium cochlearium TaxID=1494 RepID=UPI0014593577|nr:ribosome maturation factor RimP [Clostridium cochlearium]NME95002.1 ribosome maturation factor RimP [Clostridium cochlearium]
MIDNLKKLVEPIIKELDYELYYLEFVKENNDNYLRIYIDSEDGIGLEDCEKVSRVVSDMLDEKDPIESSYYLEVSSPGLERQLYNDKHIEDNIGKTACVRLNSLFNGSRKFQGKLKDINEENLTLDINTEDFQIPREKIKRINLVYEG